jgi:aminomethyltransferase
MSVVPEDHADLGAVFDAASVPEHYGRPERTHQAVRNGVGVTEMADGVVEVTGPDRAAQFDARATAAAPREDGTGRYALLLDEAGRIEGDLYAYATGDRLLLFLPRSVARDTADRWQAEAETAGRRVDVRVATDEFGVFGVHGPQATEKVASVLHGAGAPDRPLTFVRGETADHGVTVVRTDAPTGESSYEVVCAAAAAERVFDGLLTRGLNAVPFGRQTWRTLTLEAGTPLFETELRGRQPGACGVAGAVGQSSPGAALDSGRQLVGLRPDTLPPAGAAVLAGGDPAGEVTRAARSPTLDAPVALAVLDRDRGGTLTVEGTPARRVDRPFVEGSERSGRLPET